jgi:hypothetical protein
MAKNRRLPQIARCKSLGAGCGSHAGARRLHDERLPFCPRSIHAPARLQHHPSCGDAGQLYAKARLKGPALHGGGLRFCLVMRRETGRAQNGHCFAALLDC